MRVMVKVVVWCRVVWEWEELGGKGEEEVSVMGKGVCECQSQCESG